MNALKKKQQLRQKRVWRIRKKVVGTAARPRLCVTFTNAHIFAQAIDDRQGQTLACLGTAQKAVRDEKLRPNVAGATELGKRFAETAKAKGIESVIFDRHGRPFHGRVKAFADAAREAGLQF